ADFVALNGSCTTEELDHGITRSHEMLLQPRFDAEEFGRLKEHTINQLLQAQENPRTVASHELTRALFAGSVLGRISTPDSVAAISLDDVKRFFETDYRPNDAILILSGDVTADKGKQLAQNLLADWKPATLPPVDLTLKPAPAKRRIILVDRPDAKQSAIQMGVRAYDIHTDEKFAGSLANQILTAGIESRLNKYVRAEKGLVYGIHGVFTPTRYAGSFTIATDTRTD